MGDSRSKLGSWKDWKKNYVLLIFFNIYIIFAFSRRKGRDGWEAMWSYQAQPSTSNKGPQIRATGDFSGGRLRVRVGSRRVTTPFIRNKGTTGNRFIGLRYEITYAPLTKNTVQSEQ